LQGWARLVGAERKDFIRSQLQIDHKRVNEFSDDAARRIDDALISEGEDVVLGQYNMGFSQNMLKSTEEKLSNLNIAVRFVPSHAPWRNGLAEGQIRLNKREFAAAFIAHVRPLMFDLESAQLVLAQATFRANQRSLAVSSEWSSVRCQPMSSYVGVKSRVSSRMTKNFAGKNGWRSIWGDNHIIRRCWNLSMV
jgi:hypothetical protein